MRNTILPLALAAIFLAGCTGLSQRISDAVSHDRNATQSALASTRDGQASLAQSSDGVIVNHGLWLSGNPIRLAHERTLPGVFSQPATFDRDVASLQEFAEHIARLTHVPTRVAPNALAGSRTPAAVAPTVPVIGAAPPPLPTLPGLTAEGSGRGAAASAGVAQPTHIAYRNGDLRGLLDAAATRFGVSWKFADGAIVFFFTDTRTFQVSAIPGDATINANVMSGSTSDGSSASSNGYGSSSGGGAGIMAGGAGGGGTPSVTSNNTANTVVNSQLSVFNSLRASIQAMLSPYGSVVSSPATGSITVTDTPDVLDRVASYMDEENATLSKQVLINVTVLSVTQSAQDSYGINWNAVYQALGTAFTVTNTFPTTATNPVSFAAQVITPSSRAAGTQAMISALSSQGTVRRKTSASITTLNNQPVPVQVATQQGYLASVSTTNTANVGSQTSLVPGTITTGFNMTLLPHLLDNGTVLLQFYTNISSLVDLQTVTSGGQQIQTPDVDTRNFLQRVSMKSGETLVLSGYEGTNDNLAQQGVGKPTHYFFGGGYDGTRQREVIVILITPIMMNGA